MKIKLSSIKGLPRDYIKSNLKNIIFFLAVFTIISLVLYLYALPLEAVLYAFLICSSLGIVIGTIDFIHFAKKTDDLKFIKENIRYSPNKLPDTSDATEKLYGEIIEKLYEILTAERTSDSARIADINDYYTLWCHQIKTPIAAMHLLLNDEKNGELSEQLFRIEQYVDMVLTYIRCGDDSSDYLIRCCDLDNIIKSCIRKYSKLFIRKKISMNFSPTEMTVLTDEKWMSFVVEQLLSNALKYTKTGSISVFCEDGKHLVIKDTGIGIAAEDLPQIMQKGYTGYNGRQDKKSTGLGLFLCGKICSSLGHSLEITSKQGKGTTVKIGFDNPDIRFE